jgi:hypothetical protein
VGVRFHQSGQRARLPCTRHPKLVDQAILNPVAFDENGNTETSGVLSGTKSDGTLITDGTCRDWTSTANSDYTPEGATVGGPVAWVGVGSGPCSNTRLRVFCVGVASSTPAVAQTWPGKKIWVTANRFVPGGVSPDTFCASNAYSTPRRCMSGLTDNG